MVHVVYSGAAQRSGSQGKLFEGIKFFLSQKVPQRSRFVDEVESNGGLVERLEQKADIKIVDHARKEQLPGTYSYTFIEVSVRNGVLENLADHAVGPPKGAVRTVGSIVRPAKATRSKFTVADDIILWDWVNTHAQEGGGTDGNEIYKQLEAKHPQHPWQSWRDRYIKKLKGRPRPFTLPHNAPPTPPADLQTSLEDEVQPGSDTTKKQGLTFTDEDTRALMTNGADLMKLEPAYMAEAWEYWVTKLDPEGGHSAKEWQTFWEETVRPRYRNREARRAQEAKQKSLGPSPHKHGETLKKTTGTYTTSHASPGNTIHQPIRSPSYHPESPTTQPEASGQLSRHTRHVELPTVSPIKGSNRIPSPKNLKRKLVELEEELPSSSPPEGVVFPKRHRKDGPGMGREIPSTPDRSPSKCPEGRGVEEDDGLGSPTFVGIDEENTAGSQNVANAEVEDMGLSSLGSPSEEEPTLANVPLETILEPDRSRQHTQALFREPTPYIDFEVAEPDEGWDVDDASSTMETHGPHSTIPETQAIFHSATQLPEFDLPPPDGGWASVPPSSPPAISHQFRDSDSQISSSSVRGRQDLWVASYVEKGFSEETVEDVLWSTSLDMELAENVLKFIGKGKRKSEGDDANEIPNDWRGVWTAADDENLKSTDARSIMRLQEKHGEKSLQSRWEFLDFTEGGG